MAAGEPVAWRYELATVRYWEGDKPTGWGCWSPPKLSLTKPCVPEGSIRNLTPLYADDPAALRAALHLFREFLLRNVTQWDTGAGVSGHPMWAHIAEILGAVPNITSGPEWQFIQPDNRQTLADLTRICRICDGGPGNECACNCGHQAWEPAA